MKMRDFLQKFRRARTVAQLALHMAVGPRPKVMRGIKNARMNRLAPLVLGSNPKGGTGLELRRPLSLSRSLYGGWLLLSEHALVRPGHCAGTPSIKSTESSGSTNHGSRGKRSNPSRSGGSVASTSVSISWSDSTATSSFFPMRPTTISSFRAATSGGDHPSVRSA